MQAYGVEKTVISLSMMTNSAHPLADSSGHVTASDLTESLT